LDFSGYLYGNPEAIGNQIYPSGLSKYYDVFSLNGIMALAFDYLVAYLLSFISSRLPGVLSYLPLTLIFSVLNHKTWDNIGYAIVWIFPLFNFG